ncbi:MAG: GGDEF domain-containing protein [Armatimonadota bacterium]
MSVRGLRRKRKWMWSIALIGLLVCWWLQPPRLPEVVPVLLLLLVAVLMMAQPVGRMGTRTVRFGGSVVFFATLLYGSVVGSVLGLVAGWIAQVSRRERNEILLYAPVAVLSAQVSGIVYGWGTSAGMASLSGWQGWLFVVLSAGLFSIGRMGLLWCLDGMRSADIWRVIRAEAVVDGVTLPAIMAALSMHREWGWFSVLLLCVLGTIALFSARAFIEAHHAQRQIHVLRTMHQRLIAHLSPDDLVQDLGAGLQRLLPLDRLSLWSYARQEAHLQIVGVYPQDDRSAFPAYLGLEGALGKVVDGAKLTAYSDTVRARIPDLAKTFDGHLLILPLAVHGYLWGLLVLERKAQKEPFTKGDYQLIEVLVEHLAILLENLRLYRQTADQAVRDGLTGLLNHRRLQERMKEELSRSLRYQHPMTLLMIDVDYFKRYNDTYGHQQGDEVLRILAQILRQHVRHSDIVGRYGGEEFAVVLPETNKDSAVMLAQRLCEIVASTPFPGHRDGLPVRCTISVGVASYPEDGLTVSELIAAADSALYRAKRFGKNRVVVAP